MKLLKTLAAIAVLALMMSCDLGTPPQLKSGGGTEVEGILVDPNGIPAAGIWVRVYPDSSSLLAKGSASALSLLAIRDSALTNSNGEFVLPDLPAGSYNLFTTLRRNDTTWSLFRRSITVSGNLNLGTDTLRVAGSLTLTVTVQGAVVAGAKCHIPGSPFSGFSNLAGECALKDLPPGTYQVSVSVAGLPAGQSGPVTVLSLQVTPAGTLNLEWTGEGTSLNAPLLTAPAQGAVAYDTANLTWNAVSAATSYDVQVSTDSLFTFLVVNDSGRAGLHRPLTVTNGTQYRWRVRARNSSGVSSWSLVRSFTGSAASVPCPAIPPSLTLTSPANMATNVSNPASLSWAAVCGASSYRVQIAMDSSFANLVYQQNALTALTVSVGLSAGSQYLWRVSANLSSGAVTSWSQIRRFTTRASGDTLANPALISPVNSATNVSLSPTFQWVSVPGATRYSLQVSRYGTSSLVYRNDSLTGTSHTLPITLLAGTEYTWHIRNVSDTTTSGYASRNFTTTGNPSQLPATPSLRNPGNDSLNLPLSLNLSWNIASGADSYLVQVSTDTGFVTLKVSDTVATSSAAATLTHVVGPLSAGTLYYWRVGAVNSNGTAYSTRRRFRTAP